MAHFFRALTLTALFGFAAPAQAAQVEEDPANISLGLGIQKVINIPGVARIAVGDPKVADIRPLNSGQLILLGQAEGRTSLLIWKSNGARLSYTVNVRKKAIEGTMSEIKDLLGDREGITIRSVGDRIFLEGFAYTAEDFERVGRVTGLYPQTTSFVKMAPNAARLAANNLNASLQRAGLKSVQANVVGSTIFLEGSVESQQDLEKAELITRAMGLQIDSRVSH